MAFQYKVEGNVSILPFFSPVDMGVVFECVALSQSQLTEEKIIQQMHMVSLKFILVNLHLTFTH